MFRGLGRGIVATQTLKDLKGSSNSDSKVQSSVKPVTFGDEEQAKTEPKLSQRSLIQSTDRNIV